MTKRYKYSYLSLNRGLLLSVILLLMLLCFAYIFGEGVFNHLSTVSLLTIFWVVYAVIHIKWDIEIKKKHCNVSIDEDRVIFHVGGLADKVLLKENISVIEEFPSKNNIYDDDYISNITSSGVRVIAESGDKYIVFRKISNYQELIKELGV